jgi:peptidoglycan/xylan/chitin deacetylase (PgdA/CDA1 family)
MRKQMRAAALTVLKSCGVFRLVQDSSWRRQRLLILCYHGIALEDEDQWRPFLYISRQQLERRLNILRKGKFNVLPLSEALEQLRRNNLPPRSVALTFDDGTYDFHERAYPLLKQFGFPATVYLTTYYSELHLPVFSLICSYMLWKARKMNRVDLSEFGVQHPIVLDLADNREAAVSQIVQWADRQDLSGRQKDDVAAGLAKRLCIDYAGLRAKRVLQVMNSEEVKQLGAEGVDFQLHTHRHRMPLQEDLFRREIRDNREHIANIIGGDQKHFCYPSGAYRPEFLDWLSREDIVSATTCDTGFATPQSNPLLLPRFVDTGGRTDLEFESWVNGIGHFLSRRRRARMAYVPD